MGNVIAGMAMHRISMIRPDAILEDNESVAMSKSPQVVRLVDFGTSLVWIMPREKIKVILTRSNVQSFHIQSMQRLHALDP